MGKSAKQKFEQSAYQAAQRAGGSHLTREARSHTMGQLKDRLSAAGYQNISSVEQVALRHVKAYVESRMQDGVSVRTLQNEMSHIRAVMRPDRASAPQMTNKALGIDGGSRISTKTAVTDRELRSWTDQARQHGREGIAQALEVSRELGLRSQEVIRADAEQLRTWSREASANGRVTILHGTKGGRVRDTTVVDPERTVAVLERAAATAQAQGGYLIAQANGAASNLKSALSIYRSYNHRQGINAHRCRYAYAREVYQHHKNRGHSHREACRRTSVDLGHGSGRGRYVRSVYLR